MNNIIEYRGRIFAPDKPEQKFDATLKISDKKIKLITSSEFKIPKSQIVIGVFNNIGHVTLLNFSWEGSQADVMSTSTYGLEFIFTNVHLSNQEDLVFDTIHINLSSFYKWFEKKLYHYKSENELNFPEENDIRIEVSEDFDFIFSFRTDHSKDEEKLIIEEYLCLIIESKHKKLHFTEIVEIINHFIKFILFSTTGSPNIKSILLKNKDYKYQHPFNNVIDIDLLYKKGSVITWELTYSPTFVYKEVEDSFNKIIKNWYAEKDSRNSIDLILEKKFLPDLSRENYFLNACFAIETFNRNTNDSTLFIPSDFEEIKRNIFSKFEDEEDILDLLKKQLIFANEPSFKERLLEYKEDFKMVLADDKDTEKFISKIVRTRNSFVHQIEKKNIFKNVEIYYAAKYIESVLKFNIYKRLEVPEEVILKQAKFLKSILPQAFSFNSLLDRKVKLLS